LKRHWSISLILLISAILFTQSALAQDTEDYNREKFVLIEGINITSLGEFKESWESASGFNLGYGIIYSDQGSLILQTGYMNFKANDEAGIEDEGTFKVIPFHVGGRYYITMDRFRPFVLGGSGFNIVQQKWATADTSFNETSWQLNFQVGLGLDVLLFSGLQLELTAKYNSHLLEPSIPYNITGLEYGIGLVWRFSPAIKD